MKKCQISPEIEQYLAVTNNSPIVVAISWWPDSMLAVYLLVEHYTQQWRDTRNIVLAHYDHRVDRKWESERSLIQSTFPELLYIWGSSIWIKKSEEVLRKERWTFLYSVVASFGGAVLVTWHNLTDRLETTLLNIRRWCHIKGFLNMTDVDQRLVSVWWHTPREVYIVRPLLHMRKPDILSFNSSLEIPYILDPTNEDEEFSQRNKLRKKVLWYASRHPDFRRKLDSFYTKIAKTYMKHGGELVQLRQSLYWQWVSSFYRISLPITRQQLIASMSRLWIYKNLNRGVFEEIFSLLSSRQSGHMQYAGWWIFQSHGFLYVIKSHEKFWKDSPLFTQKIVSGWRVIVGDFVWDISDMYIWCILRFPKVGDKYGSKSLTKIFLNKKVPLFWRNFIPILEKEGKIVAVLPIAEQEARR